MWVRVFLSFQTVKYKIKTIKNGWLSSDSWLPIVFLEVLSVILQRKHKKWNISIMIKKPPIVIQCSWSHKKNLWLVVEFTIKKNNSIMQYCYQSIIAFILFDGLFCCINLDENNKSVLF